MTNQPKNPQTLKILLIGGATASIILISIFSYYLYNFNTTQSKISQEILNVTQPVNSIDGIVTSITGDTISFEHTVIQIQQDTTNYVANAFAPAQAVPTNRKLTLRVKVSNAVPIIYEEMPIPFQSKNRATGHNKYLDISEIKKGQKIIALFKDDLRTTTDPQKKLLIPSGIVVLQEYGVVSGNVISTTQTSIKLSNTTILDPQNINTVRDQIAGTIEVSLPKDFEISQFIPPHTSLNSSDQPKSVILKASDIRPNTKVIVFSSQIVTKDTSEFQGELIVIPYNSESNTIKLTK